MIKQRTIKTAIRASGVGLHSGLKVSLGLLPAPADSGIVFRRIDLPHSPEVAARAENVKDTQLSTTLVNGDARVSTVEHLMSALAGMGIDNVVVEVDAEEIPIMDGSAAPFVFLIQTAGIQEQFAAKRFIQVLETIEVQDEGKWARFEPYDGFKIAFTMDFDHPVLKTQPQTIEVEFSSHTFINDVSRARTFGFTKDLEWLRANNLARGGSLDNVVVVDDRTIVNDEGLRYQDEFVKHKLLDAIGDLYQSGNILASFHGYRSGHGLNNQLLRALVENPQKWRWVTMDEEQNTPISCEQPALAVG